MRKVTLITAILAFSGVVHAEGTLQVSVDNVGGAGNSYTGGTMSTPIVNGVQGKPIMAPLRLSIGASGPTQLYDWVTQAINGHAQAHKLVVGGIAVASPAVAKAELPAVSRSDKSAAEMVVTFDGLSSTSQPAGSVVPTKTPVTWLRSNFSAELGGIAGSPIGVSAILISIPQMITNTGMASGKVAIAPFHLTFDLASQKALDAWKSSPTAKPFKITYEATKAETKVSAFVLTFAGCSPSSLTPSATSVDVAVVCSTVSMTSSAGTN